MLSRLSVDRSASITCRTSAQSLYFVGGSKLISALFITYLFIVWFIFIISVNLDRFPGTDLPIPCGFSSTFYWSYRYRNDWFIERATEWMNEWMNDWWIDWLAGACRCADVSALQFNRLRVDVLRRQLSITSRPQRRPYCARTRWRYINVDG